MHGLWSSRRRKHIPHAYRLSLVWETPQESLVMKVSPEAGLLQIEARSPGASGQAGFRVSGL